MGDTRPHGGSGHGTFGRRSRVMILALWIGVIVLAVAVVVLFGALIEMFEQLKQLRRVFGFEDGTSPVELPRAVGLRPSEAGLPVALDEAAHSSAVLFISDVCATCHRLAEGLRDGPRHPRLWVVVVHISSRAQEFVDDFALYGERVVHDTDKTIVNALGVEMTPVAIIVSAGRMERAQSVPSLHQLDVTLRGLDQVDRSRTGLSYQ